jgi:hypothetical protein
MATGVCAGKERRLYKALLVASIAMLACCAAAALAGPVYPVTDLAATVESSDARAAAADPSPLHFIAEPHRDPAPTLYESFAGVDGFDPSVSLSATSGAAVALASEDMAVLDPAVQPAVIPLPVPLYACAVLLALALFARRAILRAC